MLKRRNIKTDLCVVGGGLAGLCTAIAAARNGINVVLMHERPVLGGNASSEIRMWVCGAQGRDNRETGIIEEILLENYYRNPTKNYFIWDTVLYDFAVREKNLTLLLNCTCMDAETEKGDFCDGRNTRITRVTGYQMTTQTFIDVEAHFYADCSGDSILAPLTGAEFRTGREAADEYGENTSVKKHDNMTMGMSCMVFGRETEKPVLFTPPEWSQKLTREDFGGRFSDLYNTYENFWYLELGGNRDSIHDTDEVQKELIPLSLGTWDYVKNSGDQKKAENWEIDFIGFLPGKRESRRMMGEYIVTEKDIMHSVHFEDTVAYGGWPVDDHYPAGFYNKSGPNTTRQTPAPYCLPYRALYSKNVENLYFAGRNISMTHMAMSSIRVMATCALLGQAVGTAAALAMKKGLTPHGVYLHGIKELQKLLTDADCFLPGFDRPVSDKCRNTELFIGGELVGDNSLRNGHDRYHIIYDYEKCGVCASEKAPLEYRFSSAAHIGELHVVFDSDLNRETLPGDECERYHSMRANVTLDSPEFYVPKTLCRKFRIEGIKNGENEILLEVNDNRKRAYHIATDRDFDVLRLVPLENWCGDKNSRVISFDFD